MLKKKNTLEGGRKFSNNYFEIWTWEEIFEQLLRKYRPNSKDPRCPLSGGTPYACSVFVSELIITLADERLLRADLISFGITWWASSAQKKILILHRSEFLSFTVLSITSATLFCTPAFFDGFTLAHQYEDYPFIQTFRRCPFSVAKKELIIAKYQSSLAYCAI